jgi:hypothetical protein
MVVRVCRWDLTGRRPGPGLGVAGGLRPRQLVFGRKGASSIDGGQPFEAVILKVTSTPYRPTSS